MSQTASALDASCDGRQHGGWSLPADDVPAATRDIDYDDLDKFKYYTIGPACAFVCRFLLYPFSLVKTRLQMQKGIDPNLTRVPGRPKSAARAAIGAGAAADCVRYTGTFDAFGKILRHEGPRGLFKGFPVSCIGIVSGQLYITTYEIIRQEAKRVNDVHRVFSPHTMDVIRNGVAGGTASLLSQTVVVPVDIVSQKQMMMSKVQQPPSMIQLGGEILAREGVMGFYRGFFASVMVFPFPLYVHPAGAGVGGYLSDTNVGKAVPGVRAIVRDMVEFLRLYAAKVDAALGLDKHHSLEAQRAGNLGCHGRHCRDARHQPNRRGPHTPASGGRVRRRKRQHAAWGSEDAVEGRRSQEFAERRTAPHYGHRAQLHHDCHGVRIREGMVCAQVRREVRREVRSGLCHCPCPGARL
jgi:hypothetical protein